MSAFALDPTYNDWAFTANRITYVTGAAECAQKLNARFGFQKGEWFLDQNQGMPWIPVILGLKNPSVPAIRQLFTGLILGTPGVKRIDALPIAFNGPSRKLTIGTIAIEHDSGAIIQGGRGQGFYVVAQKLSATPSVTA